MNPIVEFDQNITLAINSVYNDVFLVHVKQQDCLVWIGCSAYLLHFQESKTQLQKSINIFVVHGSSDTYLRPTVQCFQTFGTEVPPLLGRNNYGSSTYRKRQSRRKIRIFFSSRSNFLHNCLSYNEILQEQLVYGFNLFYRYTIRILKNLPRTTFRWRCSLRSYCGNSCSLGRIFRLPKIYCKIQ